MKKFTAIAIIWVAIIFIYIILAAIMPAWNEITTSSVEALDASANMTQFPGTKEVVQTSPLWVWFIPGTVGIVSTVVILKRS